MAVLTKYLVERKSQYMKDKDGNIQMFSDKALADAFDRKLDAIELIAEMMVKTGIKAIDYDAAFELSEALLENAEKIQNILKPVIIDIKKRERLEEKIEPIEAK